MRWIEQGRVMVNKCCIEGCNHPGVFRTYSRPTWCSEHLVDQYRRGGLELIEKFTKPNAYLLTRCLECGFEGHYRFEYVLDRIKSGENVCRACFWREWAVKQRVIALHSNSKVNVEQVKALAEEHGFTYLGPLTSPSLDEDPHATQCNRCGRIEAQRPGDIGWGYSCSRNAKSARYTDPNNKARLFRTSESDAVTWWDHDRNDEELWQTARPGSRKSVWWVCPRQHHFEEKISNMSKKPFCPICIEADISKREEEYQAWCTEHRNHTIANIPELLEVWADSIPPDQVPVVSEFRYQKFRFRCQYGHHYYCNPVEWNTSMCPHCRGLETKRQNQEAADADSTYSRLTPEKSSQWDYERNAPLKLASISPQSRRNVWWKDPVCGHEFQAVVRDRDKYQRYRCPVCHTVLGSLAYQYPELALEWDLNNSTTPWHIRPFTTMLAEPPTWICPKDPNHRWQAMPVSRVNGAGCPQCRTNNKSSIELRYFEAVRDCWKNVVSGQRLTSENFSGHSSWQADIFAVVAGKRVAIEYDGAYWYMNKRDIDIIKTTDLLHDDYFVCRVREHPLESLNISNQHYLEIFTYPGAQVPSDDVFKIQEWLDQFE